MPIQTPGPNPNPSAFQVHLRRRLREVKTQDKNFVFAINATRAVKGGHTLVIRLKEGEWPEQVSLLLEKKSDIEHFGLVTDRLCIQCSKNAGQGGVKAFSGQMPFVFRSEQSVVAGREFEDSPPAGTLKVNVEKEAAGLKINLPANLCRGSRRKWSSPGECSPTETVQALKLRRWCCWRKEGRPDRSERPACFWQDRPLPRPGTRKAHRAAGTDCGEGLRAEPRRAGRGTAGDSFKPANCPMDGLVHHLST